MRSRQDFSDLRKFVAPEYVFGNGARYQAGRYARNFGARKVLIVTDPGIESAGWVDSIKESLEENSVPYSIYNSVTPNPRDREVMSGASLYLDEGCDVIIAAGGGSPIDCAKGISVVASNGGVINDYEGADTITNPGPPLICIPTTAGTAADVSQFSIIVDTERKVKFAIISKAVVPDVSLIDPETTLTMDPFLSACTGLDTLVHAFESFVSNARSPLTDHHALRAISLVNQNLPRVMEDPSDPEPRKGMMLACLEAGLAFSNASLGAVHAMAHSLGGYLDLPHGQCNAMLLEHVVAFNYEPAADLYEQICPIMDVDTRGMRAEDRKRALVSSIRRLRKHLGVGQKLSELGVRSSDIPMLAEFAVKDPCLVTNPREAGRRDLEVVYEEAL